MGENGSGKTTLVKLLTGELVPQDGFRSAHRLELKDGPVGLGD